MVASTGCSSFGAGFLFQKPLSQKERSTFLPSQPTTTLISSVDWGLDIIERQCPDAIASFKDNEYVFPNFWTEDTHQANKPSKWDHLLTYSNHKIDQGIKNENVQDVLDELFDRLYVLRNQLLHGGATWQGSVNRRQVNNGAAIMRLLVPYFINIMLDNPAAGWGEPYYSPHRAWQHNSPKI